jgi:hypothetical protein
MRKLIVSTFLTLDGVMQAPGGSEADDSSNFAHGGWSVYYFDEQVGQFMGDERAVRPRSRTQDLRYLRRVLAASPEEAGAKPLNDATKYVASRSYSTLQWSNPVLIEGEGGKVSYGE